MALPHTQRACGLSGKRSLAALAVVASLLAACGGEVHSTTDGTTKGTQSTDTTPPAVTITAPTSGPSFNATTAGVTVSGSVTDNFSLSQISWQNSRGGSGGNAVSGTSGNWSFNIGLQPGANVVTVTAADAAGNTTPKSLTINYAPPTNNTAVLSWDVNPAPDVAGYRVYYGTTPGTYQQARGLGVNVGNVTTFTVTGLAGATRYYFAATAYDTSNNESDFSNEVFKDFP
jgi:hypothetical protein